MCKKKSPINVRHCCRFCNSPSAGGKGGVQADFDAAPRWLSLLRRAPERSGTLDCRKQVEI